MNAKLALVAVVLLALYTFAIWKWSQSSLREELLSQSPPRDTTVATDTGKPLAPVRDSIDVRPLPPPAIIRDTIPDTTGVVELRAIITRKDSVIDWLSAAFSESIAEYGHRIHLHYRPEIRRLYYDWIPPLPLTTTTTITETRYLPALEEPFWFNLHAGGRTDRLAGGLTLGFGPFGVTRLVTAGEKPLTLATYQGRFSAVPWPF